MRKLIFGMNMTLLTLTFPVAAQAQPRKVQVSALRVVGTMCGRSRQQVTERGGQLGDARAVSR